jgi:signal transduction histidine kinase
VLPWLSGLLTAPLWWLLLRLLPPSTLSGWAVAVAASTLAPLPGLAAYYRRHKRLAAQAAQARETAAQLKSQLETVRFRTARLREDLSAADQQARLSRQLSILGQFTAGFMHEFNNPLSIVTSRLEVLLEEREDDAALCADLQQMLQEARYMGNIARTLLQALRRERGAEGFEPSVPSDALTEAAGAQKSAAGLQGVRLVLETAEVPHVNVPEHVVSEVVRGLIANSLQALRGREGGAIWLRLEPYRAAGSKVVLRVEDNGPGLPENIRAHLFEPFITQNPGRERLGLGLFLAASLLDMYDGRLRYETRDGGGASFVVEMPPARFLRGQPYHWFAGGDAQ